ncbi:MAG: chromosome partitioning protein ParB, partial [Parvibaculaceae bacterium]|nr:chromosome partitioning protein ParB [Parvibaculaceae bacterium]
HPEAETLARKIVAEGMSVRGAEALVRADKEPKPASVKKPKAGKAVSSGMKDADTRALEKNISDALGLAVSVNHDGEEGGDVTISYLTLEQLDEICRRLAHGPL